MENDRLKDGSSKSEWDTLRSPDANEQAPRDTDHHKIGEAILDASNMAEGTNYDMADRVSFTNEQIKNYRKDIMPRNLEFLERVGADETLKRSYRQMMREYPFLRSVMLGQVHPSADDVKAGRRRDEDIQNARSCYAQDTPEGIKQVVQFNFKNPDIYHAERYDSNGDLNGFYTTLVEIALRVGAKPADVANNRALVSTFILAHEFGHATDFQQNFIAPEVAKARKAGHTSGIGVIALPEALARKNESRSADMAETLFGGISTDKRTNREDVVRSRFADLDLRTPAEQAVYRSKSYRKCRSENYADTFAMNFVMRHYDEFFYDPRKGEKANGRVATNLYGETKSVGEKLLPYLDFHAGKHISISAIDAEGNASKLDGYLNSSLRLNENLKINLSGDPTDHRPENIKKLAKVENIRMKQEKGPNGSINTFYLMMDDFSTIELKVSGNGEAPDIPVDPSDFLQRYHMSEGSQLSLLKRKVKNGEMSAVSTGGLLSGRLAKNKHSSKLIDKGVPIYLSGDSASGARGGNTSGVRRFYRRWKRYYVETETSTYELLPYLPDRSKH
jgi:hypothetical protein